MCNLLTDVPSKPTQLQVVSVDATNVSLAWQQPQDNGGSQITGYVVDYKEVGNSSWSTVNSCTAKYTIKVVFFTTIKFWYNFIQNMF